MDHVENVEIEEIVEIIREFTKHGEEVVDKEKLQLRALHGIQLQTICLC
jgi:hypothetical protein